ncbi:MAG: transglycosylase SLT domain-containing protein [Chromatiales bacterium]|nr:transglycosylase SLT domain-containing protein [Chromatiales bacterium]
MRTFTSLASAILLATAAVHANPERVAADRQAFLAASALVTTDPAGYATQRRKLDGYVLAPYLDYAALRRDLRTLDAATARRFLEAEATTQLGTQFRREYLLELARRGDWPGFLAFDEPASATATLLRCQRVRALLAAGRTGAARTELLAIWPTGQSLPDACDEPIATARSRGWLSADLVWQRLRLAVDGANTGLASHLARLLPDDQRGDGERLARALADPEATLLAAANWPDRALHREAAARALQRRARADVASAIGHWERLAPRFSFAAEDRTAILQSLALYAAVAYRPDAELWFEQVPVAGRTEQLMDWQLRAALATQDWPTVLKIADGLPAALALASRPRYWRARALAGMRRDGEARAAYGAVATEANFHGFLAADQLEAPYAICPKDIAPDPDRAAALRAQTDVARALELHAVGRRVEANRAWDFARDALGEADRRQLALLASQQGWHDRVAFTLNSGDDLRHYDLRFPLAERETVEREASLNSLEPSWAFALIRAESAWQPDVRSEANALGLMQLLPGTGQQMARQLGLDWRGTSMLLDPQTNIRLGTRYLAQQAARFQGSTWLASAAYNAGPTPVERWLAERGALPADVFIETIPYRETREYVTRVEAFSVIYDWRLNGQVRPLSSRLALPGPRGSGTAPAGAPLRAVVCPGGTA